jgi:hypothetical protein
LPPQEALRRALAIPRSTNSWRFSVAPIMPTGTKP